MRCRTREAPRGNGLRPRAGGGRRRVSRQVCTTGGANLGAGTASRNRDPGGGASDFYPIRARGGGAVITDQSEQEGPQAVLSRCEVAQFGAMSNQGRRVFAVFLSSHSAGSEATPNRSVGACIAVKGPPSGNCPIGPGGRDPGPSPRGRRVCVRRGLVLCGPEPAQVWAVRRAHLTRCSAAWRRAGEHGAEPRDGESRARATRGGAGSGRKWRWVSVSRPRESRPESPPSAAGWASGVLPPLLVGVAGPDPSLHPGSGVGARRPVPSPRERPVVPPDNPRWAVLFLSHPREWAQGSHPESLPWAAGWGPASCPLPSWRFPGSRPDSLPWAAGWGPGVPSQVSVWRGGWGSDLLSHPGVLGIL